MIIYFENKPSWTIKKLIFHSDHIGFFSAKGLTHDFGQKWKISLGLCLDKVGQEIMFDDHLVRKQALLDYEKLILSSGHIGFFSAKGLTLAWISDDYFKSFLLPQ